MQHCNYATTGSNNCVMANRLLSAVNSRALHWQRADACQPFATPPRSRACICWLVSPKGVRIQDAVNKNSTNTTAKLLLLAASKLALLNFAVVVVEPNFDHHVFRITFLDEDISLRRHHSSVPHMYVIDSQHVVFMSRRGTRGSLCSCGDRPDYCVRCPGEHGTALARIPINCGQYCYFQEEEECDFDDIRQLDNTCLNHFWDRQNRYRFLQFGFEVRATAAASPIVLHPRTFAGHWLPCCACIYPSHPVPR